MANKITTFKTKASDVRKIVCSCGQEYYICFGKIKILDDKKRAMK